MYLDGLLIQLPVFAQNEEQKFVFLVLKIITKEGLKINTKCQLHPGTEIRWLGKNTNTTLHQTFPNGNKICQHMTTFWQILKKTRLKYETQQI